MQKQDKVNFLIVDDSPTFLTLISNVIKRNFNCQIFEASSAFEAMRLLGNHRVDIILLDVNMPEVDGFKTAKIIRQQHSTGKIPIIYITNLETKEEFLNTGFEAGGIDFISKPFKEDELIRVLNLYIRFIQHERSINHKLEENQVILYQEIELRKNTEENLRESEEKFRTISSAANDAIMMTDENDNIVFWNSAATNIFGYYVDEVLHKNLYQHIFPDELHPKHQIDIDLFANASSGKLIGGRHELKALRKDKKHVEIDLSLSSVMISGKWHTISIARDITERKQALVALEKSELELRELNTMKDKFFSIIAHDLKNPFGAMKNMTEIMVSLYDNFSEKDKRDMITEMKKTSESLYNLLDNLLTWARSQSKNIEFLPEISNISEIVNKSINLAANQALQKNIEINNNIDSNWFTYGDTNMLYTIFRNLINNAVKFSNADSLINIEAEKKTGALSFDGYMSFNDEHFEIKIIDSGIGISQEDLDKLFRLDIPNTSIGTGVEKGTGLGLKLCKEFIEKHGGSIHVKSELNKGTEIIFTLPVH